MTPYTPTMEEENKWIVCESIAEYSGMTHRMAQQLTLFPAETAHRSVQEGDIKVVELFAGVGGFRIGLERASRRFVTVWNNQWEPSTKKQDASIVYTRRFGSAGHSNEDIATVPTAAIPNCDLLCGGFPCQDYSVATTLRHSGGIEGKKGVLWWQIHRILREKGEEAPQFLMLENVDRLLVSPAGQRGRDFAIILASLSDLGYVVEWRVINAADYGMPQRRRRTYIVAYRQGGRIAEAIRQKDKYKWLLEDGTMAKAFPCHMKKEEMSEFLIEGDLSSVSVNFNKGKRNSPFLNTGIMIDRNVCAVETESAYSGPMITLGQILVDEKDVPENFFIPEDELPKWVYLKGQKSLKRVNKETGIEYNYSEGSMAFPDYLDRASRTIVTGEGGAGPSRFKHVIKTLSGRYRRLVPLELERLNMFPDHHTDGVTDMRRAFLMGNALVTGIVERIALVLEKSI